MAEKKVYWDYEGKRYTATATYDGEVIKIVADHSNETIDYCEQSDCDEGITLDMVWDDMPEDITDWHMV